jgi:hypothetical protein
MGGLAVEGLGAAEEDRAIEIIMQERASLAVTHELACILQHFAQACLCIGRER